MNPLQEIEQTYGFQYPKLYHRLYEDGMLNVHWQWKEVFPELKKNPPLLLFRDQFTALDDAEDIINRIKNNRSQRGIKTEYLLVPFASECEGEVCFFYDKEKPEQPPVIVKDWYDFDAAEIIADNFQNFIFYGLLECVLYIRKLLSDDDAFYTEIANMFRTHRPYLSEEQTKIVEDIYKRKTFASTYNYTFNDRECTEKYIGLLSRQEFDNLCSKFISIPKEEKQFEYSND